MMHAVLIGAGNLASHLYKAFKDSEKLKFIQVYNRNLSKVDFVDASTPVTENLSDLVEADIYFLCVSDTAIAEVSKQLPFRNRLVLHCSGASSIELLDTKNRTGVFYPLQTFIKNTPADFSSIPICVEAPNVKDKQVLLELAKDISQNVQEIDSKQRAAIHVAAVFVNNFVNYLYQVGESIMQEHQMQFSMLHPLLEKTLQSALNNSPKDLQTGPARRGDTATINKHLQQLTHKEQQDIYKILTNAILKQYGREEL